MAETQYRYNIFWEQDKEALMLYLHTTLTKDNTPLRVLQDHKRLYEYRKHKYAIHDSGSVHVVSDEGATTVWDRLNWALKPALSKD